MIVENLDIDLTGYQILSGLINAHDHLEFALFPRLGRGPYSNSSDWARDIYRPHEPPVADHLRVPKPIRLLWGGIRNLIAGVTTVCHHNPYDRAFDEDFPVRVIKKFGWAHSLAFESDVTGRFRDTPEGAPFILHLGEGTDETSAQEIFRLHNLRMLTPATVLVHAVALDQSGWRLLRDSGASLVCCTRSNLFTLGRSIPRAALDSGVPIAIGTDSSLTAEGDLLDELAFVSSHYGLPLSSLRHMVTNTAASVLRHAPAEDDWIAVPEFGQPPDLVVVNGRAALISTALAQDAPCGFERLGVEGRPPVFVRAPVGRLLEETRAALGTADIRLGGRRILQ